MKLVSWNVNGIRSCLKKGFMDFFTEADADIFCVQEIKIVKGDIDIQMNGYNEYNEYWNYAQKKGYAGTAVFSKKEPLSAKTGIGVDIHDKEGRVITLEFEDFFLVNVYTPNAGIGLKRLSYRMQWEDDFRDYLTALPKQVIVFGDFNVAHKAIDLRNPLDNRQSAGFSDEERKKFTELLDTGFIDSFRYLYPEARNKYTYWSYKFGARQRNAGWRIDYGCITSGLKGKLKNFTMNSDILGSDHCPVTLEIF